MDITGRKQSLIKHILEISSAKLLSKLENAFKEAVKEEENSLFTFVKPLRKTTKIEDLINEQNYKGVDMENLNKIVAAIDIDQNTDDLLGML